VTGITLQKKTMSQCHMKVTGLLCALEIGQLHVCKYEHDSQVFLWSEYDGVVSAARDHFLPTDIKQIDTFAVPYHCFYPRDAMLARVIAIATCLSVCPSVTSRYCVETKKASVMISSPSDSPKTVVF